MDSLVSGFSFAVHPNCTWPGILWDSSIFCMTDMSGAYSVIVRASIIFALRFVQNIIERLWSSIKSRTSWDTTEDANSPWQNDDNFPLIYERFPFLSFNDRLHWFLGFSSSASFAPFRPLPLPPPTEGSG
jgi:hypothetical protein